jgi:chromosome segregation protein
MHIKKLVLDNFKSFGRRTEIPFYEDFTTVSGPNGSGKSNIIDSVLFALGLARTRGIRAEKLTDLIYNPGYEDGEDGEDANRGGREASVEVVLDNSDGTVDRTQVVNAAGTDDIGNVEEITVKRRVKETEENYYSYYYLNGRSVNLGDIQDLLAQAGVTPEGYNVVMQGDVTEIINMTPYARREIIDEIAGVAEFDAKKEDAFEELEVVKERIGEAELRIEEKEDRLEQLKDERETALEYQELREQKEEYEGYLAAAELEDKRADLEATRDDISMREDALENLQAQLDEKEGKVVRLEDELAELNHEIERKGEDEQLRIKREIEEVKGEISRLEGKIETAEERIESAENERRQAFVAIDHKQEQIEDLESDIKETKLTKASVKADLQSKESELAEIEAEIDDVDTEYEEVKDELNEKRERLEEEKSAKNDLQREQDRLLDDARRRSNEITNKETEIEEVREQIPEIEAELQDLEDERVKARHNREQIDEVVADLKAEKRELGERLTEVEHELQAKQQEYAELEAKAGENGDTSFGRSVSTILNAEFPGVHGAIAQLGSVSEQYATACETAAGGRMANVVVDDDGVGQDCIEYLKSRNGGRATFLPLTEMDRRGLPSKPDHPGVVDFAYNLVDFDSEYEGAFSYVLGDTLVVDTLETARELMGQFRLVTLDGDLVAKSGAMTGGSGGGSRYSFSKTGKGRLERVAAEINDLEDERQSIRSDIQSVDDRLDDARDRQTDAADQLRSIEAALERKEAELESTEERIESLQEEIDDLEAERESVDEEMNELEAAIDERTGTIETIEAAIADLQEELAGSKIPELTEQAEQVQAEIEDLADRIDSLDGDLNSLQLEKGYVEESIEDLHDDIEEAQNRKAEAEEEIAGLEESIEEEEALLEEKHAEVDELEDELADLKAERSDLREDLRAAKSERDEQKDKVGEVKTRLATLREREAELETEIGELAAQVDDYDPEEVPDHDELLERIADLDVEMSKLEPVNMLAIEEYEEVADDLADLQERRATLVEERNAIRERIESYEAQKKATFMDAFEGINEQFTDIFSRLSNGTGELFLENEEDPFDGGLTMKAQPGDKPIQRLNSMSGGEKSLTALAFIFAIQRYNPAPFYALDEIDAFLDAANAERVGEMVDELAGRAQFIVVSHRSALMDRSERAIGVTMQGNNISTVTGIQLGGGSAEVGASD